MDASVFDKECRHCPRLAEFLDTVSERYPDYYCRPVPPFGDAAARLLIVGLAPGMHGANRSGRPFTGDHAGILLYQMLHEQSQRRSAKVKMTNLIKVQNFVSFWSKSQTKSYMKKEIFRQQRTVLYLSYLLRYKVFKKLKEGWL